MGILLGIAAAVAIGALIVYAITITYKWFKNKISELARKKNAKKVVAANLEELVEKCPNQIELEDLLNDGYDKVFATVDSNNKISNVEVVEDEGYGDEQVEQMLGSQGMVVVNC